MRVVLLIPALLALALWPSAARACASCGCGDPTLTVMGAETPFAGRLRGSLEARTSDVAEGHVGQDQVVTRDSRVDLGLSWAPSDRLILAGRMPLVVRNAEDADLATTTTFGAGDLELSARFVLLRDRSFAPRHALSILGGVKLPTGLQQGGIDAEPGSGSFDPLAGLAYAFFASQLSAYVSAVAYLPGPGAGGYHAGRSILAGATLQWQATPWLAPRFGVETRDDRQATLLGAIDPDSGGFVAWAAPGVALAPAGDLVVHATARLPFATNLMGQQHVGPVFSLGVIHDF